MDRGILALSRAVGIIRADLNHELPIQQLAVLLEVARNEGIPMPTLGQKLNMGQGSVSKNVKLMSQFIDNGQLKGFGLLSTEQDMYERRRFIVHTTEKGKQFIARLAAVLSFPPNNGIGKEEAA